MKLIMIIGLTFQIICITAQSASVEIELAPEDMHEWYDDCHQAKYFDTKDTKSLADLERDGDMLEIDRLHRKIIKSCVNDAIDVFKRKIACYNANIKSLYLNQATLLHYACKRKIDLDVLKYLLAERVDIDIRDNKGATPLHWAAKYNNTTAVSYLLDLGAVIEALDAEGNTPLHWAYMHKSNAAGLVLIKRNASDRVENHDGRIPSQVKVVTNAGCCTIL